MSIDDLSPWLLRALALLWGAVWGSFLQVVVYRWPRGLSVVSPPSSCPHCQTRIPPWRNLPIFGYLLLRGRSACCGTPLSFAYLRTELLTAALSLAIVERFVVQGATARPLLPAGLEALLYFAFAAGLLVATLIDLEWMLIPDEITLPGAALGLLSVGLRQHPGAFAAAVGAGAGYLLVQAIFVWLYQAFTGRRGMGEGDAKLLLFVGAFLGWKGVFFALAAGSAQGVLAVLLAALLGRPLTRAQLPTLPGETVESLQDPASQTATPIGQLKLPFGPFLSVAALEYLFFGERWMQSYFAWLASFG